MGTHGKNTLDVLKSPAETRLTESQSPSIQREGNVA